jgi:YD repeat-containing protein
MVSELHKEMTVYSYDEQGRPSSQPVCVRAVRGEARRPPSWREPMVYYEHDTLVATRTERRYASGSSVPVFGRVRSTTVFDGKILSYDMKLCYRFDGQGRRLERYQIYRMSDRPLAFDTMVRTYTYSGPRLARITSSTLNLDRRPDGSAPGVRFKNRWTAEFSYDGNGRIASVASGGSKSVYTWDEAGRLVGWGTATMAWDAQNRLASLRMGMPRYDREYHYDADGRLAGARFGDGGGYRMIYGEACVAGFTHGAFLPNVDNFEHYEGKDTL